MGGGGDPPSVKITIFFKFSENFQNALKHEKTKDIKMTPPHLTSPWMLTTTKCSHLSEGVQKKMNFPYHTESI